MVYEFTATADTTYFFGLYLVSSDDYKYVLNAHGDVVALVNSSGTITKRYEYDAFGVELNPDENDENPYRYCAEYFDIESGTIYLRARYYSPNHGRFTQLDPARDGLNWYAYCANNPINFLDSTGLRTYFINNKSEDGAPQYSSDFADELEEKGVEDVRTVGVYNGPGTISGTGEVIMEMINNGKYSEAVAEMIAEDLKNDPLEDGEELNLIGYSGGGQIVLNVCEQLDGTAKVDNSILIGAPIAELTFNNTGEVTMIYAGFDPLSWNVTFGNVNFEFAGWIGHTNYFDKNNIGKTANLVKKHIK